MNKDLFTKEIRKTGYVLENSIAQILKKTGWTVISNKYYVDDSQDTVREIDLLAYSVSKLDHFDVYTVLIISCKKSESNTWALLARDINLKDPNYDWWPLHTWTNKKALEYQLAKEGGAKRFHDAAISFGVKNLLSMPEVEVFAFQEMENISGKPQNDKPIFSSITSLMKAQAYELSALPLRKKAPCIYQFNLLSVVDSELVRLMFEDEKIDCVSQETEDYLARYIINKKEIFSRIRFIQAKAFEKELEQYNQLHQSNCEWLKTEFKSFYKDIVQDWKRMDYIKDAFKSRTELFIKWQLNHHYKEEVAVGDPDFMWNKQARRLDIGFNVADDVIDYLNQNNKVNEIVKKALKEVYLYEGDFQFTFGIPF